MAWFADLAGKAETLLNNLDEQTGAALRNNVHIRRTENRTLFSESRPSSPKRRKSPTKKPPPVERKSSCSPRRLLLNSTQCDKSKKETKSRTPKAPSPKPCLLHNNCPETLVGDVLHHNYCGVRQRRSSLPTSKEMMHQNYTYTLQQNLEVENTVLKNELNILHKEVSQLLERLKKTENGNDVVSDQDLTTATAKLEAAEKSNREHSDKLSLSTQFEELKLKVHELTLTQMEKQKQRCKEIELEMDALKKRNTELEEIGRKLTNDATEFQKDKIKADKDLKHAQTVISELESNLEKTTAECRRLERDWEAYKLRVKTMLHAKDKEINRLQKGVNLTEDTKVLIEQMEGLKKEREELSEIVTRIRNESSDLKRQEEELEARHAAAERVVAALREALKDERAERSRADAQITALAKELKTVESETNKTIASLHAALREKDNEISRLKEARMPSSDTSALNVADYDDQASIDEDKIRYLTHTLVQRQGKIDSLLADNNMLRIQLEKIESKYKAELSSLRAQQSNHSMVTMQDDERSRRARHANSFLRGLSRRVGIMFRYPVFRMFVLFYMLGLHFWVITVLLTSTPDIFTRSSVLKEGLHEAQPFQT